MNPGLPWVSRSRHFLFADRNKGLRVRRQFQVTENYGASNKNVDQEGKIEGDAVPRKLP